MTDKLVVTKTEKNVLGHFERKIKPEWMPDILVMSAEPGITYKKITEKIKEKWGVDITVAGIRKAIKEAKVDRSEITKALITDKISEYIVGDLDILKTKKSELVALSVSFKADKDWANYFKTIDRIKEYSEMLFELSGANEKQVETDAEAAKQDLMEMFEKFQYGKGD